MSTAPEASTEAPVRRIETVDDMATMIIRWHQAGVNDLKQLFNMPIGVEMTVEGEGENAEKTTLVMQGDVLLAFQTAIHVTMKLFGTLPFAAVMPPAEDANDDPVDTGSGEAAPAVA